MTVHHSFRLVGGLLFAGLASSVVANASTAGSGAEPVEERTTVPIAIDPTLCTAERLGTSIPVSSIGEPVSAVTLSAPRWVEATATVPAHCIVDGAMAGVTPAAPPINFRVALPSTWTRRAAQMGGGGMNGTIPGLTGTGGGTGPTLLERGFIVRPTLPSLICFPFNKVLVDVFGNDDSQVGNFPDGNGNPSQ